MTSEIGFASSPQEMQKPASKQNDVVVSMSHAVAIIP
jgi:hypothetical protein